MGYDLGGVGSDGWGRGFASCVVVQGEYRSSYEFCYHSSKMARRCRSMAQCNATSLYWLWYTVGTISLPKTPTVDTIAVFLPVQIILRATSELSFASSLILIQEKPSNAHATLYPYASSWLSLHFLVNLLQLNHFVWVVRYPSLFTVALWLGRLCRDYQCCTGNCSIVRLARNVAHLPRTFTKRSFGLSKFSASLTPVPRIVSIYRNNLSKSDTVITSLDLVK